jgi:hypothetical protein
VQAARRQVDRDADADAGALPVGELRQRGIEAPARERLDQPGLLGVRDELVGQDRAVARVAAVNLARSSFVKVTLYIFAGISSSFVFDGRMSLFNSFGKLCLSNY